MTKGRLKITVGISGSGKSTWAHEQWEENPTGVVIVNRDKIRELLFGFTEHTMSTYYGRGDMYKNEKQVTKYESVLIKEGLSEDKTVIVDATHLSIKYLKRFEFFNVPTEIVMFDVKADICVERDQERNRQVGFEIIAIQSNKYNSLKDNLKKEPINFTVKEIVQNPSLPMCFLLDLDGTIAHMKDRSPYD